MPFVPRSRISKAARNPRQPPRGRSIRLATLEGEVREAVLRIFERQAEVLGTRSEELIRRLGGKNLDLLLEQIDWESDWDKPLRAQLAQVTRDVLVRAGTAEIERLGFSRNLVFRLENEAALRHAREYVPALVREVSGATKEAIRQKVATGWGQGRTTREMAREIRQVVGLTSRQASTVDGMRARWREAGISEDDIAGRADRQHARLLRYRSQLIANTETIRAYNAGTQAAWTTAASEGLLDAAEARRFWSVGRPKTAGGRACEFCTALAAANAEGVGLEEPFRLPTGGSVMLPPAHPACRCGVVLRFE